MHPQLCALEIASWLIVPQGFYPMMPMEDGMRAALRLDGMCFGSKTGWIAVYGPTIAICAKRWRSCTRFSLHRRWAPTCRLI